MPVLMEVFSGDPPCPGCVAILAMADRVRREVSRRRAAQ